MIIKNADKIPKISKMAQHVPAYYKNPELCRALGALVLGFTQFMKNPTDLKTQEFKLLQEVFLDYLYKLFGIEPKSPYERQLIKLLEVIRLLKTGPHTKPAVCRKLRYIELFLTPTILTLIRDGIVIPQQRNLPKRTTLLTLAPNPDVVEDYEAEVWKALITLRA